MTKAPLLFSHITVKTAPLYTQDKPIHLEIGIQAAAAGEPDKTVPIGWAGIVLINTENGLRPIDGAVEDYFGVLEALGSVKTAGSEGNSRRTARVGRSVAVILDFNIEKPYRGKGIGALAFHMILSLLCRFSVDDVILRPFPYEVSLKGFEAMNRRLMTFYARFGFLPTVGDDQDSDDFHMVKHLPGNPLLPLSQKEATRVLQEWLTETVLRAA